MFIQDFWPKIVVPNILIIGNWIISLLINLLYFSILLSSKKSIKLIFWKELITSGFIKSFWGMRVYSSKTIIFEEKNKLFNSILIFLVQKKYCLIIQVIIYILKCQE